MDSDGIATIGLKLEVKLGKEAREEEMHLSNSISQRNVLRSISFVHLANLGLREFVGYER
jgi:hypothetical protein